jgi:hypothetical protein
VDLLAR